MITKITTKFFWTTVQKNFSFSTTKQLISLGFLLLIFACNNKPEFVLSSFKTSTGWGYVIKKNDKIIIKQSIIPVIQNIKSFESETEALKVGNLVLDKLEHKTSPTITKNNLILLSIKI
ncbi:DUF4907 domain-containing protein [Flavobacterium seoulense]|uniref:DUF4907 domain-containing protein n=1 Tax=Flavobacterium seoulense TaxID=1492738 RepID=A0A066WSW1_9FLAO|nr:DUF4907 domain-containing protein [Flavobacterium seoulense]KDN56856.1 hypothetical protein FEM21_03590 [Flavobacterium seoulense]